MATTRKQKTGRKETATKSASKVVPGGIRAVNQGGSSGTSDEQIEKWQGDYYGDCDAKISAKRRGISLIDVIGRC